MSNDLDLFTLIVAVVTLFFCLIASVAFYRLYHDPAEPTSLWTRTVICFSFYLLICARPAALTTPHTRNLRTAEGSALRGHVLIDTSHEQHV